MGAENIDPLKNVKLIKLPDLAFKTVARELELQIKQWLVDPASVFVLDFTGIHSVDQSVLTMLMRFQMELKKIEKRLFSINVDPVILKDFKQRGLEQAMNPMSSMDEVKREVTKKPNLKVDASLLAPFVAGTAKAFEVQIKLQVTAGKIASKNHMFEAGDVVAGVIDIEIDGFSGSVALCFTEMVFKKIYKLILGDEIQTIDKDSADAAGELINIIYGHAKTALNQTHGLNLKPVLPKILLNPPVEQTGGAVLCLPFNSEAGNFRLEILVK
jgi:chemotaxis protein CheX